MDCFPVTLPDLVTIRKAAGVPDIETFVHVAGDGFPQGDLSALPDGPSEEMRRANRYQTPAGLFGCFAETIADTTIVDLWSKAFIIDQLHCYGWAKFHFGFVSGDHPAQARGLPRRVTVRRALRT